MSEEIQQSRVFRQQDTFLPSYVVSSLHWVLDLEADSYEINMKCLRIN